MACGASVTALPHTDTFVLVSTYKQRSLDRHRGAGINRLRHIACFTSLVKWNMAIIAEELRMKPSVKVRKPPN